MNLAVWSTIPEFAQTERLWMSDHQLAAEAFYNSYLQNLRRLVVRGCDRLKYLFPFAIAQCLVQLQELDVRDCRDMEEILFINYKEFPYNSGLENKKLLLKLQDVSLYDLPKLTGFCSTSTSYNIVNCCLNTKKVWLQRCPNLFEIDDIDKQENHDDQDKVGFPDDQLEMCRLNYAHEERLNHPYTAPSFYISNITSLHVTYLHNSEYLMSASVATSFVHLKDLSIYGCESMKEVVVLTKEFRQGRSGKIGLFPSLKYLSLNFLPELERFCRGYNDMEYLPNLKELFIKDCGKFATFITNSTDEEPQENLVSRQPLIHDQKVTFPNLKSLTLTGCSNLHQMVQHEEFLSNLVMLYTYSDVPMLLMDILDSHQYRARTKIFQNLECLQLGTCSTKKKLLMPSWVCFQALTVLIVDACYGVEYLLTPSTAKSLQLLKVMKISNCSGMREIIQAKDYDDDDDKLQGSSSGSLNNNTNKIVCHHLEILVLNGLTSLTCFHSGNCALEFPKLSQLVVGICPEMRNFCDHVLVTAPKLQFFIDTDYQLIPIRVELDSSDHVQVHWELEYVMNTVQLMEGGGHDKYININNPIRHLWEKSSAL